ncbi:MAG: hypothetical protein AAB588_06915 [Patescibacteria group bacterium]
MEGERHYWPPARPRANQALAAAAAVVALNCGAEPNKNHDAQAPQPNPLPGLLENISRRAMALTCVPGQPGQIHDAHGHVSVAEGVGRVDEEEQQLFAMRLLDMMNELGICVIILSPAHFEDTGIGMHLAQALDRILIKIKKAAGGRILYAVGGFTDKDLTTPDGRRMPGTSNSSDFFSREDGNPVEYVERQFDDGADGAQFNFQHAIREDVSFDPESEYTNRILGMMQERGVRLVLYQAARHGVWEQACRLAEQYPDIFFLSELGIRNADGTWEDPTCESDNVYYINFPRTAGALAGPIGKRLMGSDYTAGVSSESYLYDFADRARNGLGDLPELDAEKIRHGNLDGILKSIRMAE